MSVIRSPPTLMADPRGAPGGWVQALVSILAYHTLSPALSTDDMPDGAVLSTFATDAQVGPARMRPGAGEASRVGNGGWGTAAGHGVLCFPFFHFFRSFACLD